MNALSEFEIHIYGNILDNRLAKAIGSFDFVRIMGYQKVIPYKAYDAFLHTAMIENLPISICEALNNKVPVVAFNVGGINEVVSSENGILINPWKFDEMARSLDRVINKKVSFSFEDSMLDEFDWDQASNEYSRLIFT